MLQSLRDYFTRLNATEQPDNATTVGKLLVVWISTITGLTISEWAALFALIYTILQIYILVRDKIWRRQSPPTTTQPTQE